MMGADLLLTSVPFPVREPEGDEPPTCEQMLAHCLAIIESADEHTLRDAFDTWQGSTGDQLDVDEWAEVSDGEDWRTAVRGAATDAAKRLFGGPWLPRDTATMRVEGKWHLFAGGTSWGDSFESMDDIEILYGFGCFTDATSNAVRLRLTEAT